MRDSGTPGNFGAMRLATAPFLVFALALATGARAAEVQRHGYLWETWIADTFFEGYRQASYTQAWDIPAEVNKEHGGIPANPKVAKHGGPIDLGDAFRQFDVDEPFLLIIGYWVQEGDSKRIVNVVAPRVEPATWRRLWGDITRADVERFDALVKDRSLEAAEVRRRAKAMKAAPPFSTAVINMNPKIGADGQRRLQCSLSFKEVFDELAPDKDRGVMATSELWGVPVPGSFYSPPRSSGDLSGDAGPHEETSGSPR